MLDWEFAMNFYQVNQRVTFEREFGTGYLCAPNGSRGGWPLMNMLRKGDILETEHPHVVRDARGRLMVGRAGLKLHVLAAGALWVGRLGWSLDQLAASYPFLSMAEILDALSSYLDHRGELNALTRANRQPSAEDAGGG
jgi:hypothetical protein